MNKKLKSIQLTDSQINNLIELLEFNFITIVREDEGIDNMEYLVDMCDIFVKLKTAREKVEALR